MISRRKSLLYLLAASPAIALADAFYIEPRMLSMTRRNIFIPNLPAELDGLRIAHLTDFHYKPDKDHPLLKKVVSAVNQEEVDLIALTGDYVNGSSPKRTVEVPPLLDHIIKMKSRFGTFATMGNHDGWTAARSEYREQFEKAGGTFLINQNTRVMINGSPLYIAGTDYVWKGGANAKMTLRGIPANAPILALVHEPDFFDNMTAERDITLQLSGHTHGGQCRVPLIGYAPRTVRHGRKYIYGHYQRGNSQLFVSRGVGTTGIRVRFACPPELAILTLKKLSL